MYYGIILGMNVVFYQYYYYLLLSPYSYNFIRLTKKYEQGKKNPDIRNLQCILHTEPRVSSLTYDKVCFVAQTQIDVTSHVQTRLSEEERFANVSMYYSEPRHTRWVCEKSNVDAGEKILAEWNSISRLKNNFYTLETVLSGMGKYVRPTYRYYNNNIEEVELAESCLEKHMDFIGFIRSQVVQEGLNLFFS